MAIKAPTHEQSKMVMKKLGEIARLLGIESPSVALIFITSEGEMIFSDAPDGETLRKVVDHILSKHNLPGAEVVDYRTRLNKWEIN